MGTSATSDFFFFLNQNDTPEPFSVRSFERDEF
jgi:hypothetical protein